METQHQPLCVPGTIVKSTRLSFLHNQRVLSGDLHGSSYILPPVPKDKLLSTLPPIAVSLIYKVVLTKTFIQRLNIRCVPSFFIGTSCIGRFSKGLG